MVGMRKMPCLASYISAMEVDITGPLAVLDSAPVVLEDWQVISP